MPAVVYIAEKENCALIIEAPDIAVPPEITEAFQAVWVGTASQIIRLNQTLTQRNILPIQSPLVHFIVVPARSMIIAACETDAYFIRADGFLLKHEPFHDLLSSCVIQSESLICDFFEGTQAVFDLPEPFLQSTFFEGGLFMNYEIKGGNLPVVICTLQPGETMVTESGAMSWMSPNMKMETGAKGGLGGAFGRMFSGESIFQNRYTAQKDEGLIAFASSFPGEIRAVDIAPGRSIVVQKRGFLACTEGVELSVFFQKKFGTGFFGGEGFIMQKLSGHGMAFLEIDGSAVEYTLAPGQQIIVDTGNLAMVDATCQIDVQTVRGAKNVLFGGEGLFNTVVTGPGRVVLQTMALPAFASALIPYLPAKSD